MNGKSARRIAKKARMKQLYKAFEELCRERGVAWNGTRQDRDRILGTPSLRCQLRKRA